jgi:hypothetical protein
MLEHVRQGGKPYDVRGSHITEMVSEIATLSRFNRASAGRVLEGVTAELVTEAQQYYKSLRENLKRMGSSRGYQAYFESWHPAETTLQEELVDSIKTMFVEQTLDSRIEAALPVLARLQQENRMKEADIFESWAEHLSEGTWSLPETPEQQQRLQDLMSRELIVGPDATNATEQLDDLVGDDILFDRLSDLASRDASANVWDDTDVQARLAELGIQLPAEAPADPAATAEPVVDPAAQPVQQQPVTEGRVKELEMDIVDPLMSDEEFETKYGDSRANMQSRAGRVQDRRSGEWYDPAEKFDQLKNSPEFQAQMKRMAQREGMAEVSKSTLDRYVTKASDAHGDADFAARMSKHDPDKRSYHVDQKKTAEKRRQGISRALDRMSRPDDVAEGSDDKEPFDYEKWKASTVKPRKPRGYKDAEALGKALDREQSELRKRKEQGVAEGEANAGETLRSQIIKLYKRGLEDYDIAYDLDIDEKIVADIIDDYDRKQQQRRAKQQGMAEASKEKTPGVALSKAYQKDFDGTKPVNRRPETALTGTYSKTGKPGGELKKRSVAEGVDPATYPARAREAHEKYLKYENMVDQELRKLGQRLPQSWDAARMHQKLSSDAKYALALKYYDLSEKFASLSIRYEELAKKRGMTESLLDEFVEGLNGDELAEDAVDDFLARGGEIQQGKFRQPRKSEKTDYGSRHIGGQRDAVAGKAGKTLGRAAATNFKGGGKAVVGEGGCNHTQEGEMCPEHGLTECGMHESQVAESQEGNALLARIKSLALLR